jgi:hypothetical protein
VDSRLSVVRNGYRVCASVYFSLNFVFKKMLFKLMYVSSDLSGWRFQ